MTCGRIICRTAVALCALISAIHCTPFRDLNRNSVQQDGGHPGPSRIFPALLAPLRSNLSNSAESGAFKVCDKTPEKVQVDTNYAEEGRHLSTYLVAYHKNKCTKFIQGTDFTSKGQVQPSNRNGFLNTVVQCFNGHHNLVIRPDDIWTAIISQFSLYVNGNAERFRRRFVKFDGKKTLEVKLGPGSLESVSYARFVELMSAKIDENIVDKEIKDWITPNFTTTTQDDKITAGVTLMASLKKYFDYVGIISCGIPQITIEGTVADWKDIAARLVKLRSYKLEKWVDTMLTPILDQFIRAKSGAIDESFWNSIVKVEHVGCGSTDVSGWITAFGVFNRDGKWQVYDHPNATWPQYDIGMLPTGIVEVDVTIIDNGVKHETVMFAGHMGKEILTDGVTLRPRIGWAIALKNNTKTDSESEFDY